MGGVEAHLPLAGREGDPPGPGSGDHHHEHLAPLLATPRIGSVAHLQHPGPLGMPQQSRSVEVAPVVAAVAVDVWLMAWVPVGVVPVGAMAVGINAWVRTINDAGGVHGRELVLAAERDDKVAANTDEV